MSNVVNFEEKKKEYATRSAVDELSGIDLSDNPTEGMIQIRKNMKAYGIRNKKIQAQRHDRNGHARYSR